MTVLVRAWGAPLCVGPCMPAMLFVVVVHQAPHAGVAAGSEQDGPVEVSTPKS